MEEPFEFNDEIFAIALDTNHTTANDWAENTPFTVTGWGSTFVRNYYRSDQIRSDQIRSDQNIYSKNFLQTNLHKCRAKQDLSVAK
jgi:hypothetical protein